jgi:hypothetical protein
MKIKYGPKIDIFSHFTFNSFTGANETNNDNVQNVCSKISIYVRGPNYLIQNFNAVNEKKALKSKLLEAKDAFKFESVLFDLIRK